VSSRSGQGWQKSEVGQPSAGQASTHDAVAHRVGDAVVCMTAGALVLVQVPPAARAASHPVFPVKHWLQMAQVVHAGSMSAPRATEAGAVPGVAHVVDLKVIRDRRHHRGVRPSVGVLQDSVDADPSVAAGCADVAGPWPALVVLPAFPRLRQKLFSGWLSPGGEGSGAPMAAVAGSAEAAANGWPIGVFGAVRDGFRHTLSVPQDVITGAVPTRSANRLERQPDRHGTARERDFGGCRAR
jgi:hypothetical protein